MQSLVMLLCIDSIDDDIIANVLDSGNVTNSSNNYILKFSSCSIHAKTKALVPVQTKMSGEGGDVPGLGVQDQLVISLIEIEFAKHFCTIEVVYYFITRVGTRSLLGLLLCSLPSCPLTAVLHWVVWSNLAMLWSNLGEDAAECATELSEF